MSSQSVFLSRKSKTTLNTNVYLQYKQYIIFKMKLPIFITGVFLMISNTFFAQKTTFKDMDNYFDHLANNGKMMGSVSIFFQDSTLYSKSIGYTDVDTKNLINADTKFRVGSITKTYTATLVLKAVEEGKLKLTNKLSSFYPEVKNADRITIEQLLKHRSGIFNYTEIDGQDEWEENYHTEKEFIDYFIDQESNFEPDTNYEYSNTNYALLGFILQKVYGKEFSDILKEKITEPLKLKNTYFTYEVDASKNEAFSYNIQNNLIRNGKVNYVNDPASGGIASTPTEVNKFLSALFNGQIISKESLELMLPQERGAYGMGIQMLDSKSTDIYEHSGRVENFISYYWYLPNEKLGVVVLTNAINIEIGKVVMEMVGFAYGNKPIMPDFNMIDEMSADDFLKIKGTYSKNDGETLTISSNGKSLVFQSSEKGQMFVPFINKGNNVFEYEDVRLTFYPKESKLFFEQNGMQQYYKKI